MHWAAGRVKTHQGRVSPAIRGRLPVDPGKADLAVLGRPLAPQSPSKSDPKITHFFDQILKPFWSPFGSQNDPPNHPKTSQNHKKVNPNMKKTNF